MTVWLWPLAAGFAAGILSAWGVGGGTLLLLIMTLFLGVDRTAAQAINLLYFLPTAGAGLIFHRKNGLLDREALRYAVVPGLLTAAAGAAFAAAADTAVLRRPFGLFLLLTGGMTLWQTRQKK